MQMQTFPERREYKPRLGDQIFSRNTFDKGPHFSPKCSSLSSGIPTFSVIGILLFKVSMQSEKLC